MIISIRAEYPATGKYIWSEGLQQLDPIDDIELAFHGPDNFVQFVKLEEVVGPIIDSGKHVSTIHMAEASLSNLKLFIPVLIGTMKISQVLNCKNIVMHPTHGSKKDFEPVLIQAIFPLLEQFDCNILWETFSGKRRFLPAWEPMAQFCDKYPERNYICYDICHMQRKETDDVIDDILIYEDIIAGFHFSNWTHTPFAQHLPIRQGLLDFDEIMELLINHDFQGSITLEYMPEFHDQLVHDALYLQDLLYS